MNEAHSTRTNEEPVKVEAKPAKKGGIWKPLILLAIVVAAAWGLNAAGAGQWLQQARGWIESLGPWGPLAYIVIYIAATVACLPGSVMTVIGGGLFGAFWGTILVSIGSTIGAALCFLIARYLARGSVKQWLEGNERFQKLDALTEKEGDIMVMFTRLVPLFPFNLLNYGFGLTRVKFWTYVLWSWICMLPFTIVYVAGTDAIVKAIKDGQVPWALVAVIAIILVIMTFVIRKAKARLSKKDEIEVDA